MCIVTYGRDGRERLTKREKDFTFKKLPHVNKLDNLDEEDQLIPRESQITDKKK